VPRRFALDQNFPEPIVDGLVDWLAPDAELMPIRRIDERLATLDDWEVLQALHTDYRAWDGLITTDAKMLSLPRELAVLCQTKLTLVAAEAVGHDPIKATGLVLAHITRICEQTRVDTARSGACVRAPSRRRSRGTSSPDSPSAAAARLRISTRANV
jgi:hypothetical protein